MIAPLRGGPFHDMQDGWVGRAAQSLKSWKTNSIHYVGLGAHKMTIVVAAADGAHSGEVRQLAALANSSRRCAQYGRAARATGGAEVCCDAGLCGYGLHRATIQDASKMKDERNTMGLKRIAKNTLEAALAFYGYELRKTRGTYQSETSKCRARLLPYCQGNGIDIGPGGDPISEDAIRIDLPTPYSTAGLLPVQLSGDATKLRWFRDDVLDFVYSSHVLEDFDDIRAILVEWIRVLKPGGNLVLFCPDEHVYRRYCAENGLQRNQMHKHEDFCLLKVKAILGEIGGVTEIHSTPLVDIYSWELVARKVASCELSVGRPSGPS
jgi:SAM-dependent methyltransferase